MHNFVKRGITLALCSKQVKLTEKFQTQGHIFQTFILNTRSRDCRKIFVKAFVSKDLEKVTVLEHFLGNLLSVNLAFAITNTLERF